MAKKTKEDPGYNLGSFGVKGEGVYATRRFKRNDIVIKGQIIEEGLENDPWCTQVGINRFVRREAIITKINHSCSPNVGYRTSQGGVDYIAYRDIECGEEIVADYAMGNYIVQHMPSCVCGTEKCRGDITGWKDLPVEIKEQYKGFSADYLWDIDATSGV